MAWSIGRSETWQRDIGYGVPAKCDHPGCNKEIDRGLSYVCGGEAHGGEHGCGLFFCEEHHHYSTSNLCERCATSAPPFEPKPDIMKWESFKFFAPSWKKWRDENPEWVKKTAEKMQKILQEFTE